jgi:hypothetical protein
MSPLRFVAGRAAVFCLQHQRPNNENRRQLRALGRWLTPLGAGPGALADNLPANYKTGLTCLITQGQTHVPRPGAAIRAAPAKDGSPFSQQAQMGFASSASRLAISWNALNGGTAI